VSSSPPPTLQLALSAVLGLSVLGFFVGVSQPPAGDPPLVSHDGGGAVPSDLAVPTYQGLRAQAAGLGSGWSRDREALRVPAQEPSGDVGEAVTERAANRAYDGAPPTIPHAVRQRSAAECLACHDEGLRLRGRTASRVPHDDLASCTQCHVVQDGPMPGERLPPDATFAVNTFAGRASPTEGPRAWSIAPPQIPHTTSMRTECMACHGPGGRSAMRTPHPERQSCEQCHAPSATADQRPVGGVR